MKRIRLAALAFFSILCLSFPWGANAQSAFLEDMTDFVNDTTPGSVAEHTITFRLPVNASHIRTTDYILIEFPDIDQITLPTTLGGQYGGGTPAYSVIDNVVRITNITLAPGYALTVGGITGRYTGLIDQPYLTIVKITTDYEGILIKNQNSAISTKLGLYRGVINISALIDTPESRLSIYGYAAPETYINFSEGGSIIGTDLSGFDGHFGKIFSGIVPADHTVTVFGIDKLRLTTSPIILTTYTPAFTETSITEQLLSPTLTINKSSLYQTETLVATGTAIPNGAVTIFTDSPIRSYAATASAEGDWTYTFDDFDSYILGDYQIRALVQNGTGLTSLTSPAMSFTLQSSESSSGTACGEITKGDLNCDNIVNLTDFSILMYWWGTNNATADINSDFLVNLTDFSIMMYWWGS